MDELGRGTGTSDGATIAYITLKQIISKFVCRTIFTTHYYMLIEQISQMQGVQLNHMSAIVRSGKVLFLYKLVSGVCPASFGLNVARLARVPEKSLPKRR